MPRLPAGPHSKRPTRRCPSEEQAIIELVFPGKRLLDNPYNQRRPPFSGSNLRVALLVSAKHLAASEKLSVKRRSPCPALTLLAAIIGSQRLTAMSAFMIISPFCTASACTVKSRWVPTLLKQMLRMLAVVHVGHRIADPSW